MQTQYKKNNLQYPFFKLADKENVEQYNSVGMDSLIRAVRGGSISGGIETAAVSFFDAKLSLYTQSTNYDGKAYYNNLLQSIPLLVKSLDTTFDLSLIDTAGGNDPVVSGYARESRFDCSLLAARRLDFELSVC